METPYLERFSIDRFIAGCIGLDWLDIFVRCQNTAILTENTIVPFKQVYKDDLRLAFSHFVTELCFILTKTNKAEIPEGMSAENFQKIKPIISRLVFEHELKEDWLELY